MTRIIFFIIFIFMANIIINGDDGSWNIGYSEMRGSLYSETENSNITLEKEVLKFGGLLTPSVKAFFLFKNITDKNLEIEAGLPIKFLIYIEQRNLYDKNGTDLEEVYYLYGGKYGGGSGNVDITINALDEVLKYDENVRLDGYVDHSQYYFFAKDLKKRRTVAVD